jgi:hypothetical protein
VTDHENTFLPNQMPSPVDQTLASGSAGPRGHTAGARDQSNAPFSFSTRGTRRPVASEAARCERRLCQTDCSIKRRTSR